MDAEQKKKLEAKGRAAYERRRGGLGREFIYHDDGGDRDEHWSRPKVGSDAKQDWIDDQPSWLDAGQLQAQWNARKDAGTDPGVPSDLLHYVWTGDLAQHGEENDAIRAAQLACIHLAHHEPDTLRRRDWALVHREVTCEPVWMQMGPARLQLSRRKPEYQERVFPVLNIGGGLIRIRRSLWLPPANKDPLFLAACEFVKRPDRVTSWVEACNKYNDPIMRKGAKALDQLAKWYRPLVGRIVNEFWGHPKEYLTELRMIGLSQAIRDYRVGEVNYGFSTFAENKIRYEIHNTLRSRHSPSDIYTPIRPSPRLNR
jgi:hypothetical protein